jgi:hypothetical protein
MVTLPTYVAESRKPSPLWAILTRAASFPVLLGVLLVAGCFSVAKETLLDPDTWWHMAVGQRILETHTWPWSDVYSSTVAGTPWIAYEWLGEMAMGAAASVGGLQSATVLLVALCGILVLLLYHYATLKCADSKAAFVACATLLPVLGAFFTLRPQLFGAVFLVCTLILVERFRQGQHRALWALPLVFLLWVNTHGSFAIGFLTLAITWISGEFQFFSGGLYAERWTKRESMRLLLSILFSLLILPLTPYGTRLAAYPLTMALTQPLNVKVIQEWLPLGADTAVGKYFLALVLLFFAAVLIARPRFRLSEIVLAMFGAFAACVHIRFLLLFIVFFVPLWATLLSRWVPTYRRERDHPLINVGLIGAIAVGLVIFFPSRRALDRRVETEYPRLALQYLATHPLNGKWFNEYGWGGYLIWTGSPRSMVFIDGRADIYEYGGVLADYTRIARLEPGALQLLRRYGVTACLVRQDAPLATALSGMPGWERIYQDHLAAIYVQKAAIARP